jgi:GntR family transcriptional regulator
MSFRLEPNASEPLYQQLARQIAHRIAGGEWKEGDQLPSARQLSAELGLNFLTVNKVYALLESEGLLEVRRGLGTFVAVRSAAKREEDRLELLDELIDALVEGARSLRLSRSEVVQRVREKLNESTP